MTSLKFGTSGLRGLVSDLTPEACQLYTRAFLTHLQAHGRVFVGHDLRASSPMIASACMAAIRGAGLEPVNCGALPTPALALAALQAGCPAIMVTGSHIPDDRNGLKFYRADGEIDKDDEQGILAAVPGLRGQPLAGASLGAGGVDGSALVAYVARYLALAPGLSFKGKRIAVYQHSSVSRDLLVEVLEGLGADVVPVGRSDSFVPVDTEALRPEDVALAAQWARELGFDALVSTDGDADRPLVADERGAFLRGDIVGLLTAHYLGASTVVTPVTSTSAIELSGLVPRIVRTRVGSPYVLSAMADIDVGVTVGFEANGGVLLGSDARASGLPLKALPTRDAMLPILSVLALAVSNGVSLSHLVATLPQRRTASDRIKDSPTEINLAFVGRLIGDSAFAASHFAQLGGTAALDATDGAKFTLNSGETIHYRASGNAPELRCYTEAETEAEALKLLQWGLDAARRAL